MKARTPEERKAYADGFNVCFEMFVAQLKHKKVSNAIKSMEMIRHGVNSVVEREPDVRDQE